MFQNMNVGQNDVGMSGDSFDLTFASSSGLTFRQFRLCWLRATANPRGLHVTSFGGR
jgi:hypothetical protein